MLFKSLKSFYNEYELPLARVDHEIDRRGVLVDQKRLDSFKIHLTTELEKACQKIEQSIGLKVVPKMPKGTKTPAGTLNISSPKQLIDVLTNQLGIKLKKDRFTGNYSTGEEELNEAYAETSNETLKDILQVRELVKIKGTYAETTLLDSVLYSSNSVTGTVTGRRSSRKTIFTAENGHAIGTNSQNLPKQSELGRRFRECLVARPGKIFLSCDQTQAEDWSVSAIIADVSGNTNGLDELRRGVDRHRRLASQIFNKPESECVKGTMYRFMGKKTRHAGNYGMQAPTMAVALAKEGFAVSVPYCALMLRRFHEHEPEIQNSFQHWIRTSLDTTRLLRTPVGRERYFFGLRPFADNGKIYKEAYSYIPQSTVGDNTGLACLHCERVEPGWVILDGHDALTIEIKDDEKSIEKGVRLLTDAFHRTLTFPLKGVEIEIPIEFEIGYDLKNEIEFKSLVELPTALTKLRSLKTVVGISNTG